MSEKMEKMRRRHDRVLMACGVLVVLLLAFSAWQIGTCVGQVERIGLFSWSCKA